MPIADDRRHFADLDGSGSAVSFSLDRRSPALVIENNKTQRIRVNKQIRISPVRVIANDGEQLGVLPIDEALAAAQARGLDLVEVAPLARPPVVKIMDYGKFKFEQAKAARAAKKKQHVIHLKEVKYRPGIDDHDFAFKTRHAREFLQDGNKVKVTMMYRGRQMAHIELGRGVLDRVAEELKDISKVEQEAKLEGRNMSMVLAPK
ncbi:MAG: translation initiation factor IF-3 [Gemmatimonadetes bacterium]|nr:MAG: translation initiation factor IF-3 [Gemmatimonadota bacterium]